VVSGYVVVGGKEKDVHIFSPIAVLELREMKRLFNVFLLYMQFSINTCTILFVEVEPFFRTVPSAIAYTGVYLGVGISTP